MNSSHAFFELLEARQLFSVGVATLDPVFAKGTTWTYNIYGSGKLQQSYTSKEGGVISVGGVNCNEVTESQMFTNPQETVTTELYLHEGSKGLVQYKSFGKIVATTGQETRTITDNPPQMVLPKSLTAKQTVTAGYALNSVTVDNPGNHTTTVNDTGVIAVELASEKTSPLKTAGGKFDVYTVYTSESLTENGKTSKTKSTVYFATGYGMVETDSGTQSIQLLKFKKAPKAASAIAITGSAFAQGADSKSLWSEVGE